MNLLRMRGLRPRSLLESATRHVVSRPGIQQDFQTSFEDREQQMALRMYLDKRKKFSIYHMEGGLRRVRLLERYTDRKLKFIEALRTRPDDLGENIYCVTQYLKPKLFKIQSGDGATDEYAYRQRRNALERIYDDENNLAKANFCLSYAGKSTLAAWSTKADYEYLIGTSNCMHTHQADQSRDNSKMLLSMYMFSSDLFSERLSTDLVPILANFKAINLVKHEQFLRLIDPRCPMYFLTNQQACTYHMLKQFIVPHWQNTSGNVTLLAMSLMSINIPGSGQEVIMTYIMADANDGVYNHQIIRNVNPSNLQNNIHDVFKSIPMDCNYVIPILWNGIHASTNSYLAYKLELQDEDALAEDVIMTQQESLISGFFDQTGKKHLAKRQEIYVDRFQKNEDMMRDMYSYVNRYFAEHLVEREYPYMADCGVRKPKGRKQKLDPTKTYPKHVLFPKIPGRAGFPQTKWQRTEVYPVLYGITKTPENNHLLSNDGVLREIGRSNQSFIDRQMLKLDPEWWDEILTDWKEINGMNYMLELAIFMEFFRRHLDLMYHQPLADIPFEQHKYLGNRQYEKNLPFGDCRDWEVEYLEKILGNLDDTYYAPDGTWAYFSEYEAASAESTKAIHTSIWD